MSTTEANIQAAIDALEKPFHAGTRVTNCVVHMGMDFSKRPKDCALCSTDIRNHLSLATRVNDFLNEKVGAALERLKGET